jgi:hypothetical protein
MARFFNKSVYTYNKFNFTPRIYDAQKEKLEEMKANAYAENSINLDGSVNEEMLRRRLNKSRSKYDSNEKMEANRLKRLFLLLALLGGLVIWFIGAVRKVDSGVTYFYENGVKKSQPSENLSPNQNLIKPSK